MCKSYGLPLPRRYRQNARKAYLAFVKCRKHTGKKVREAIEKQLFRLYQQQEYMYRNHVHSVPNRIVSISQPWIRPIVRGKAPWNLSRSLMSALTGKAMGGSRRPLSNLTMRAQFNKKYILKDIAFEMLPRSLLDRPKQGFGVPLADWMRTKLHAKLLRYADAEILKKQGIFNSEKIWEFIRCLEKSDKSLYNSVLWSFCVFQMWYQEYMEDLWGI